MLKKILKNTTVTDIFLELLGVTVPALGQTTINVEEYIDTGTEDSISELSTYINSGDIVINDGSIDLSTAEALRFIEYPDRVDIQKDDVNITRVVNKVNLESGPFDVIDEANGKVTIKIPAAGDDLEDNRMIHVVCVDNGDCDPVVEASILIDHQLCFIKKEEC